MLQKSQVETIYLFDNDAQMQINRYKPLPDFTTRWRHKVVEHYFYRPRKDAELPGLEKVENLIWAQLA
jgi:hypothetical protein